MDRPRRRSGSAGSAVRYRRALRSDLAPDLPCGKRAGARPRELNVGADRQLTPKRNQIRSA
jgi:hypothetical protein